MNRTESPPRQGGATEPAAVPERPALAPDVHLIGEMQGTGFKDRQWLIQRQGRFIQVTELPAGTSFRPTGRAQRSDVPAPIWKLAGTRRPLGHFLGLTDNVNQGGVIDKLEVGRT